MAANSHEDRTHWVSAIQDSIQVDPAYDIVRQKKAALRRKSIRFVYIFLFDKFFFLNPIFWKIKNNFDYIYRPRDHDIPTNSDSGNGNSEMVATVSRSKSNVQGERADNL